MKRTLAALFFLFLIVAGCNEDNRPLIPYVYVNRQLYPNSSMDYIPIGGYKYLADEGYRGILIYRLLYEEFVVYERCCPYDPEKTGTRITVDPSNLTCTDSICMSKFVITDGSPISGPSPYALMQYRWNYDGEVLYIYN